MTTNTSSILKCFEVVKGDDWLHHYINFTDDRKLLVTTSNRIAPNYVSFSELVTDTSFLDELIKLSKTDTSIPHLKKWCDEFTQDNKDAEGKRQSNIKRSQWLKHVDKTVILSNIINSESPTVKAPASVAHIIEMFDKSVQDVINRVKFGYVLGRSVVLDNNSWPCMSVTGYFIVSIKPIKTT